MSARKTPARHTVRVEYDQWEGRWWWIRESANHIRVAESSRLWPERRHCIDAAKSEARLTGARLVIDGQEVKP